MGSDKSFERMQPSHKLVEALKESCILNLVRDDKDMSLEIREDYVNVYYKMGNIFKIRLKKEGLEGEINPAYIPINEESGIKMRIGKEITLVHDITQINKDINSEYIKKIKKVMNKYTSEESQYQTELIKKNRRTLLDAEIAYNSKSNDEDNSTRIDLMNYDKANKAIVAVEIKMISDPRIISNAKKQEVTNQLKKYSRFLSYKKDDIIKAYKNVLAIKRNLSLPIDEDVEINDNTKIVNKPILVVICYDQKTINQHKEELKKLAKDDACALFMFGKSGDLGLSRRKDDNKVLYDINSI